MSARSADHTRECSGAHLPEAALPRRRYLLFSGAHDTPGGLRDLVGLFEEEATARRAFTAVRLSSEHGSVWAELGAVDSAGNLSVLCWFGHDRTTPGMRRLRHPALGTTADSDDRRPPFWRRWTQGARSAVHAEEQVPGG